MNLPLKREKNISANQVIKEKLRSSIMFTNTSTMLPMAQGSIPGNSIFECSGATRI